MEAQIGSRLRDIVKSLQLLPDVTFINGERMESFFITPKKPIAISSLLRASRSKNLDRRIFIDASVFRRCSLFSAKEERIDVEVTLRHQET